MLAGCAGSTAHPGAEPPQRPRAPTVATPTPVSTPSPPGTKPFPNLDWHSGGAATLIRAAAPRSTAINDVNDLYADGDLVLAATRHGLSRSTDGGRKWTTVLRHPDMWSVTRGPTGFVALGTASARQAPRPLTATSPDGIHWRTVAGRVTRRARFFDEDRAVFDGRVGVAVSSTATSGFNSPMVRSTDGGRSWKRVADLPAATGGLQLLANGTMYATAQANDRGCAGGVYRSIDLGATWTLLSGSCSRIPLLSLQFFDSEHAIAVGGAADKFNGGQIIESTSDGGLTWIVTHSYPSRENYRRMRQGFGGADFSSPSDGYVRLGICVGGQNGPCGGAIFRTVDGGRHLTRLPRPDAAGATSIAISGATSLVVATTTGGDIDDAVATTIDAGRQWRLQAPARQLTTNWLTGRGTTIRWRNTLGRFISHDGGRRWQAVRGARAMAAFDRHRRPRREVASYGSDRWSVRRLLSKHPRILHSADRGHTWTGHQVPRHLVLDASRLVATGPDAAILVDRGSIWRTTDGGARWQQTWPHLPGEG
jgi:photosystem II stability/assembly factor-like uncharacterized protein